MMSEREILERLRADTRHALSHQRGTSLKFESESHPAQSELRKNLRLHSWRSAVDWTEARLTLCPRRGASGHILLQCGMPAARNFDPLIKDQYDV